MYLTNSRNMSVGTFLRKQKKAFEGGPIKESPLAKTFPDKAQGPS